MAQRGKFGGWKLDQRGLARNTAEALLHIIIDPTAVISKAPVALLKSFKKNDDPTFQMWELLTNSLQSALIELAQDYPLPVALEKHDLKALNFLSIPEELEIPIDIELFSNPRQSKALSALILIAENWLSALNFEEQTATNAAARLPAILSRKLSEEWTRNSSNYTAILPWIQNPFATANQMESEWIAYTNFLVDQINERVFEETFSLESIYVSPRYYHDTRMAPSNEAQSGRTEGTQTFRNVGWLQKDLIGWIENQKSGETLKIISGGPGAGKSSLSKMLAVALSTKGYRTLLIPLRKIDLDLRVSEAISSFLMESNHFSNLRFDTSTEKPLIFILDGLDEIQLQGKASLELASQFVNDAFSWLNRLNAKDANSAKMIITGRELSVQSASRLLRMPGEVLHLIPYFVDRNIIKNDNVNDPNKLLEIDQRDEWWRNYGKLKGLNFNGMPKRLSEREIGEVTSQPLLNYLVALAYEKGLNLKDDFSINAIYKTLIDAVYDRSWADEAHPSIGSIDYKDFYRLLEEVAVSVWQGSGQTTTSEEVTRRCQAVGLSESLSKLQGGVSSGVASLMLAFYFRQKDKRDSGEQTYEFTHKTFMEYLVALHVKRFLTRICAMREDNDNDFDRGLNLSSAKNEVFNFFSHADLDSYIIEFLKRELSTLPGDDITRIQRHLCEIFSHGVRNGWELSGGVHGTSEVSTQVARAEVALLCSINICSEQLKSVAMVDWGNTSNFERFLNRARTVKLGYLNNLVDKHLSWLDFGGSDLSFISFFGSKLMNSNMSGCHLALTTFLDCDISNSDLTSPFMFGAVFDGSNLNSTQLSPINHMSVRFVRSYSDDPAFANSSDLEKLKSLGAIVEQGNEEEEEEESDLS